MIKTASSKTTPARLIPSCGKVHYTFNPQQVEKEGETHYEFRYVEIDPPVTRRKIIQAIVTDAEVTEEDAPEIDGELALIDARLDGIGQMTWTEIDQHIDAAFGGLSVAQKTSLKTLYKCVLALVKIR